MKRVTGGIAALSFVMVSWATTGFARDGYDYLAKVRSDYSTIVLARIVSADTVKLASGYRCFFRYKAEVSRAVRGKFEGAKLDFTSEGSLVMGDEYLVYFSRVDALVKRYAPGVPPDSDAGRCRKKIDGFHLLGNELQHKTTFWNGKRFVDVIDFGDHLAEVPPGREFNRTMTYYDFEFLVGELSK